MSESTKIIKNTGYLYIKTFVSMLVMLYVTRVILQALGAEDFGIYNVVGGAISMLGFLNTSMAGTVQRFLNNAQGLSDQERQKKIFNVSIIFHIAIASIMLLVLLITYVVLYNGVLNISPERIIASKIVYACLVVNTIFTIITVPYDASINAHEDMLTYSIIGIIDIFIKLIVALCIKYISGDRLIYYGALMMLVPILSYVMMKFYCTKKYPECRMALKQLYDKDIAREMLSFASWNFVGVSGQMVGNYGLSVVLNHFWGALLNAAIGIANQIQGMLSVLSAGLMRAINPIIYKKGATSDVGKMMQYSYLGCKYSFILLAILAIPVLVETHFVLFIWLGEIPEWAILFVKLQLIRALLEQLTATLARALESTGKIKEYSIANVVLNILPLPVLTIAFMLGSEPYWYFIVGINFMVLLISIVKFIYCYKYCNFSMKEYTKEVLIPCTIIIVSSILAGVLPLLLGFNEGWIRFIFSFLLSSLVLLLLSWMCLSENEKMQSMSFVSSMKNRLHL